MSTPHKIAKGKITVRYGTRPIGNQFGIHTKLFRSGQLETEDLNKAPWPTEAIALERSKRNATAWLEMEAA